MSADQTARRVIIAVTLVCGVSVLVTAGALAVPALRSRFGWEPAAPAPTYSRGERIDVSPDLYQSRTFTLIVFARHDCAVCQRAKPILTSLVADLTGVPGVTTQVVTALGQRDEEARFVEELGLDQSHLWPSDTKFLKIKTVPALVLVNREGRVLFSRDGVPTEDDRATIVRTVKVGS